MRRPGVVFIALAFAAFSLNGLAQEPHGGGSPADKPESGYVGIEPGDLKPGTRAILELGDEEGVLVSSVLPESPAEKAGLQKHDIILRIDDKQCGNPGKLVEAIRGRKPGEIMKLTVMRKKEKLDIAVTLGSKPGEKAVSEDPRQGAGTDKGQAMSAEELRAKMKEFLENAGKGSGGMDEETREKMRKFLDKTIKEKNAETPAVEDPLGTGDEVDDLIDQLLGGPEGKQEQPGGDTVREIIEKVVEFAKSDNGQAVLENLNEVLGRMPKDAPANFAEMWKKFGGFERLKQIDEMQRGIRETWRSLQDAQKAFEEAMKAAKNAGEKSETARGNLEKQLNAIQKQFDRLGGPGAGERDDSPEIPVAARQRAFLGIVPSEMDDDMREELEIGEKSGVLVTEIVSGTPAETGGLLKDDVIIRKSVPWNNCGTPSIRRNPARK
jgi:membrane-associated protease RseP (regulator of RpoE activity)